MQEELNKNSRFSYSCKYRVRYADVDQMGFMYYGNYARLYEIARVESLRFLGIRYRDLEDEGFIMPVYENKSRYIIPAKYDEELDIVVYLKEIPRVRIVFYYEIYNETKDLIHTGETTLVFLKSDSNKITVCPSKIVEKLKPFFESTN
jgi:acyl-CoA thioester hydrolase